MGKNCPHDLLIFHPKDLELWGFGGLDFISGNCLNSKAPFTTVCSKEWHFEIKDVDCFSITEATEKFHNKWHFLSVNGGRALLMAMNNNHDIFAEETILIGLGYLDKRFSKRPNYEIIIVNDEPAIVIIFKE